MSAVIRDLEVFARRQTAALPAGHLGGTAECDGLAGELPPVACILQQSRSPQAHQTLIRTPSGT